MIRHQIFLPESLNIGEFDVKMILAAKLFEDGRLTTGQASEIVGVSKRTFIEILGKYNVSIFGYGIDEIEEDITNA